MWDLAGPWALEKPQQMTENHVMSGAPAPADLNGMFRNGPGWNRTRLHACQDGW